MLQQTYRWLTSTEAIAVRRFLRQVAAFLLIPIALYLPFGFLLSDAIVERVRGPSMEKQILISFDQAKQRDYDLLIMGNSRFYRGLNPDKFSARAFNFSHDNDAYNQMFHKLKWLDEQGKSFRHVLLGVDYFQFSFISDRRNHYYNKLFGESYAADFPTLPWYSTKRWFKPGLIRGMNPKYLFESTAGRAHLKNNGQYIKPGRASPDDTVVRNTLRLPLQVGYFEKILEHCERQGVTVFLCMMPIRAEEAAAYDEDSMEEFHDFLALYVDGKNRVLIDHTWNPNYVMQDYTDITHLNVAAADRYSVELSLTVASLLEECVSPSVRFAERDINEKSGRR